MRRQIVVTIFFPLPARLLGRFSEFTKMKGEYRVEVTLSNTKTLDVNSPEFCFAEMRISIKAGGRIDRVRRE